MAKIGLSKPYFAKYSNTGSTVTYAEGALMGKAVELSLELEEGDDNILYADNGPAESANTFSGGSLTLTTDDLLPEVMMQVLGVTEEAITSEDIQTETPKWYNWDDKQNTPYLGLVQSSKCKRMVKSDIWQSFCRKSNFPIQVIPLPHRVKQSNGVPMKSAVPLCVVIRKTTSGRKSPASWTARRMRKRQSNSSCLLRGSRKPDHWIG